MGRLVLVWLLLALPAGAQFREIDRTLAELSEVSGLKAKRRVDYALIGRDKVNEFLKKRVKETVKPEEIRSEELTLKKFGFVPADFDLEKTTIDLLTEQAAAFYDFKKRKLFLTDWTSSAMQETALIHELAHALADQHFGLERYLHGSGESDDGSLARMAVMEGQASWLTAELLAKRQGRTLIGSPDLVRMMSGGSDGATSQYPVFNAVPLYLRETLIFPYTEGMRFQGAVADKLGKAAIAEVFRNPPVSTQQILHPDLFFEKTKPSSVELPPIPKLPGFKLLVEGMIGELDHAILMEQYGSKGEAREVAPHWRGGAYELLEDKRRTRTVLRYASVWESEEWARRYFGVYKLVLSRKWKRFSVTTDTADALAGEGDDGHFIARLRGNVVTSVEGLPPVGSGTLAHSRL